MKRQWSEGRNNYMGVGLSWAPTISSKPRCAPGRRGFPGQTARPTLALLGMPGLNGHHETKAWPSRASLSVLEVYDGPAAQKAPQ